MRDFKVQTKGTIKALGAKARTAPTAIYKVGCGTARQSRFIGKRRVVYIPVYTSYTYMYLFCPT